MKRTWIAACVGLVLTSSAFQAQAQDEVEIKPAPVVRSGLGTGVVRGILGWKHLDADEWEPVEDMASVGGELELYLFGSPLSVVAGGTSSRGEDEEEFYDSGTMTYFDRETVSRSKQGYLGLRLTWLIPDAIPDVPMQIYAGGGAAYTDFEFRQNSPVTPLLSDHDSDWGHWVGVGVGFDVVPGLNVGADFRYTHANVTWNGRGHQAADWGLMFFAGWRF